MPKKQTSKSINNLNPTGIQQNKSKLKLKKLNHNNINKSRGSTVQINVMKNDHNK